MRKPRLNKRILILCEGMTEYIYARSLQMELPRTLQRSVSVEIFYPDQNDPKSLAMEARRRVNEANRERNPFDHVWLFFDHDNWPQLADAFRIIDREGYQIAYTSICIEHWFILHFEHCGRAFRTGEEALRYLNRLWPEYHKTRTNAYKELKERLELAIDRANMLNRNGQVDLPTAERNPYFTVQALIGFFNKLKQEEI